MTTTTRPTQEWQRVLRDGFFPVLPTAALEAVAQAIRDDDQRLVQSTTSVPPPLMCVQDWPCEGGCFLGYCGTVEAGGFGAATVGDVEEFFARACFDCDTRLGEPAACRHFLNWFDDTPRPAMLAALLPEVDAELERRKAVQS